MNNDYKTTNVDVHAAFERAYDASHADQVSSGAHKSTSNETLKASDASTTSCNKSTPLSVSAAMALAKGALEDVSVRLIGEVSEVSNKPGYKAVYFTVKDQNASLPCMMWNKRYQAAGVNLSVGMLVELTGRFTLYALKGRMNFDVFAVSLAGEGNLRLQVANLAKKLQGEGLMDAARKRMLPQYPSVIGLVTSPRGDAVHDVLRTLRRRFPLAHVLMAGVAVEGKNAATGIVEGIRCVTRAGSEVVLVVRGGGSFEDLMPFNDEELARAIAACPVPVVTGIGHEPDTTIADMVADVRASTPTHAASAASPAKESLFEVFDNYTRTLASCINRTLERAVADLTRIAARPLFCDSQRLFASEAQTIDLTADRLTRVLPTNLARDAERLNMTAARLAHVLPTNLARDAERLNMAATRLHRVATQATQRERVQLASSTKRFVQATTLAINREETSLKTLRQRTSHLGASLIFRYDQQIRLAAAHLHDLSPLAILARGYAVARTNQGEVVKSISQTSIDDTITIAVSDGELDCQVKATRCVETVVESW